ncbi:TM0106 family RecB-like putative nuclease [Tsukamurella paurometabola]|uniref:Putative RecB family nuclease, TM0106 family n=1 Tax=Tsukamurella paurometabola TaxID=2061 RepID=A0A3P8L183_TSUPA|nr:TM0106 family RecB-like putative nuclease [Tsukamurella paurometabola]UEA81276.1 TM0106 family RecB-like putative nuclease [Tsukamurella paurometabola]VDR38255.1 putative RecB family nuclease, TM0106 family [Tsukamurella paurometabola]
MDIEEGTKTTPVSARSLTGCRHRLALETRAPQVDGDPGMALRVEAAAVFRASVRDRLPGLTIIEPGEGAVRRTLAAMEAGADRIWNAVLPTAHDRRGHSELLVRLADGYIPVIVVNHKTCDPGAGAVTSPLDRWEPREDETVRSRQHRGDQMRLAHLTRMLQDAGYASRTLLGGSIGVDGARIVVQEIGPLLAAYDERFADRRAVLAGTAPTEPVRVAECRRCPWWPQCAQTLTLARDVSLVADGRSAPGLREAGIGTVDQLAEYDGPQPEDVPVPIADLRAMARAWRDGQVLVRRRPEVKVRRADVEVDVDMESYQEYGAYLWGTWLRRDGVDLGYRPFVTWEPVPTRDEARSFAEFWAFLMDRRAEAHAAGKTFAAYCYSQNAENKWLLASADRFAGEPGVPPRRAVEEFIASPEWVDMFDAVGDAFLSLEGRGLKKVAPVAGFQWRDAEAGGEASMLWYRVGVGIDAGFADEDRAVQRQRILDYNEDDVKATAALRAFMSSEKVLALPVVGA